MKQSHAFIQQTFTGCPPCVGHYFRCWGYRSEQNKMPALEKSLKGTFLVVQQLRLHLPMQRVWVQFLVRELRSHVAKKPKHETEADFPGGPAVKNPPASTGDMGLIPGPQRSHVLWNN